MSQPPLQGCRVVDLSSGIAGGYCTKLLADAGADVVKVEPPDGDPLRRRAIGTTLAPGVDGGLFQFLSCSKRSVVADPGEAEPALELVARADVVVWSPGTSLAAYDRLAPSAIRTLVPRATVVAITPFGLDGPWADRAWTEFTLQAWSGGIWHRGDPDRAPVQVGGELGAWVTGGFAAIGLLTSRGRTLRTGVGELVDVSMLESIGLTHTGMYPVTFLSVAGRPFQAARRRNVPGIEPTKDGYVGFMVVTGQQWQDFCVLVERPDWIDDSELAVMASRAMRAAEVQAAIREYTTSRTTDEILEMASLLRVPAAPIGTGATVTTFDHFVDRGMYMKNPTGGFLQPTPAFLLGDGESAVPLARPPLLGEHTGTVTLAEPTVPTEPTGSPEDLPLAGLRVADFTMFWAGPIVGSYLAMMGADVIHVESSQRPDGMRFMSAKAPTDDEWWEWCPLFMAGNTNKRGVTLDLQTERGRGLARDLVAHCDIVVENFSPRVMDDLGLGYDDLRAVNPDLIMVRMPAFGLSGPWRDRTGYAQTQEQVSGMAFVTGWDDREPMIPNGPCDPLAGIHATLGLLVALEHRRRTGEGTLVEVPMVGGALNVTAELVVEYDAYANLVTRMGNRSPLHAPQNLYLTADADSDGRRDSWVAVSVATDEHWEALRCALGDPEWARDPVLARVAGRREAHDLLDEHLGAWCATRRTDEVVATLWDAGVPVAAAVPAFQIEEVAQLQARGYFESLEHPVVGETRYQGFPTRFEHGPRRLHRRPSPTLGQHNDEVLSGLLGLGPEELAELRAEKIIGERLGGNAGAT